MSLNREFIVTTEAGFLVDGSGDALIDGSGNTLGWIDVGFFSYVLTARKKITALLATDRGTALNTVKTRTMELFARARGTALNAAEKITDLMGRR